jgi:hypothetical protein
MANEQGWTDYWRENMESLDMPVPPNWYVTQATIQTTIAGILLAAKKFGPRVTLGELVGAGILEEILMYAGAFTAAGYAGAMIGSAAVATGRSLSGGTSLSDVMMYIHLNGLSSSHTDKIIQNHPQIYDKNHPARPFYGSQMKMKVR